MDFITQKSKLTALINSLSTGRTLNPEEQLELCFIAVDIVNSLEKLESYTLEGHPQYRPSLGISLPSVIGKQYEDYKSTPKTKDDQRPVICFTGVEIVKRHELKEVAEASGFRVVLQPPKDLYALIVGGTPSSGKAAKARMNGAPVLTEAQYLVLLSHVESHGIPERDEVSRIVGE
jgi:NAD-dependent DNA ligase